MSAISNIIIRNNQSMESLIAFDPQRKKYQIEVTHDCFALLIQMEYDPAYYIRVTTDHDAGRYMAENLDPEMGDYIAGSEVPYYEYYGGYLLRLDKRRAYIREDLKQTIWINAGSYELGNETYEIELIRRAEADLIDKFSEEMFEDDEYNVRVPYLLYVPSDYDPKKKYPVVIGLHGTGEIVEPLSNLLEKMELGMAWARDSEAGERQCIVVVPQCLIHYDQEDNWTSLVQFINGHSNSPFWPLPQLRAVYNLLNKIKKEYSVDSSRVYLTGMSSGGFAAYVLAMEYHDVFAAVIAISAAANPERIGELKGVPLWIVHSDDDPLIVPSWTLDPTLAAMDEAGVEYELTRYPKGQVFWQSGHFAWEVCYHDEKIREWLFKQKLGK